MFYLFVETFFWILVAFAVGIIIGWWLSGKFQQEHVVEHENTMTPVAAPDTASSGPAETPAVSPVPTNTPVLAKKAVPVAKTVAAEMPAEAEPNDTEKPQVLMSEPEQKDDLKRIKGIGPVIEKTLNELGIYTFQQLSEFTPENVNWLEHQISFPGRVEREDWLTQANALAEG